jgi:hypothetical protein
MGGGKRGPCGPCFLLVTIKQKEIEDPDLDISILVVVVDG